VRGTGLNASADGHDGEDMIDWKLAQRIAGLVAGQPDVRPPRADLVALAAESEKHVVDYTGLVPRSALPPAERVSRTEWAAANVSGMRRMLDPVLDKAGSAMRGSGPLKPAMQAAAGVVLTAEVGVILGFLAQRVLGQYELVLLEPVAGEAARPPRLLFVEPNLATAVASLDVDETEFVTWVALHEVTHAVQFGSVPWLQDYLGGLVRELLSGVELRINATRAMRLPGLDDVRKLVDAVRQGDLVSLVARPEERATLDKVQAVMAVIEGHAEHVMDEVGAGLLPSLPQLRSALDRRRRSASAPARILGRLLGLELKLRQYEAGKTFCDAVVREAGLEALNRVWTGPDAVPTLAELERPAEWIARTRVPAVEA
jgi:coenzyme F420 biosynthesis associated uncharacterized protein